MITIGLTGSIAMGKSEVARILQSKAIPVFDSDKEVHKLYDSDAGVKLLEPYVPQSIKDGRIHRPTLSALVMQDEELLSRLEKIVHNEIANRREQFRSSAALAGHELIVFDIPLLFEKALEHNVDVTVVVSAPEHIQTQRALSRPGMTVEKLDMIKRRQMPDAEKRRRADYVIENDASLEDLETKTNAVLAKIEGGLRHPPLTL